jgi:hypothetical protein
VGVSEVGVSGVKQFLIASLEHFRNPNARDPNSIWDSTSTVPSIPAASSSSSSLADGCAWRWFRQ